MKKLNALDELKRKLDNEYDRFFNLFNTIGIVKEDYFALLKAAENFSSLLRRSDYICVNDDPEILYIDKSKIILDSNQVSYRYVDDDELIFSFPQLPKKNSLVVNKEYLFTLANTLFEEASKKHHLIKKNDRVVVFEFEYRNDENGKESLDYDNVEVSVIINALVNYFIVDDSPGCYSLFFTSKDITNEKGDDEEKKTNVYLLSKQKFQNKQWFV